MAKNSTTFDRRKRLLSLLYERPGVRVAEMSQLLDVSEGTIRNDLNALAAGRQLTRVRGGATIIDDTQPRHPGFATRAKINADAKQCIARRAAELIQNGASVLLDASTTVYHLARFLQDRRNLTVVTNGIEVGRALAQNLSNTVILLGGVLDPDGISIRCSLSEPLLQDLHSGMAFVSCSGFSLDAGLTEVNIHEAQLKSKMIASAGSVVALVDSTKFGKVDLTAFVRMDQVSHIFTDSGVSPYWIEQLKQINAILTICNENSVQTFTPPGKDKKGELSGGAGRHE